MEPSSEEDSDNGLRALHRRPSDGRWFEGFEVSSILVNYVADDLRVSRDVAPVGGSTPSMPTLYRSSWLKQTDNILHVANAVTSLVKRGAKVPSHSRSHAPTVYDIQTLGSGSAVNLGAGIFLSCLHCAGEKGDPNDFGYHTVGACLKLDGEDVFAYEKGNRHQHEYYVGNSGMSNMKEELLLHLSKFTKDVTPLVPLSFSSESSFVPPPSDIRQSHDVLPSEWSKIFPNTAGANIRRIFDTTTPECRAYNFLWAYCFRRANVFLDAQNEKLGRHAPPDAKLPNAASLLDATLFLTNKNLFTTPIQKHRIETMSGKTTLLPRILPLRQIEGYTDPDSNQLLLVGFPHAISEDEEGNEARFPKGKMMATMGEYTTWPPNKNAPPEFGPAFIRSLTHPWSQLHICSSTKGTSGGPIIDLSLPEGHFIGIDCGHLKSSDRSRHYRRGEDVEYLLPVENPLLVGLFLVFVFPALSALGDKQAVNHYRNFFGGPHVRKHALGIMNQLESDFAENVPQAAKFVETSWRSLRNHLKKAERNV